MQDHYLSYGFASPMIFLGTDFWTDEVPVYPLLQRMMETGKYKNLLLSITDDIDEAFTVVQQFHNTNDSTATL